jgi:hypothetical protein
MSIYFQPCKYRKLGIALSWLTHTKGDVAPQGPHTTRRAGVVSSLAQPPLAQRPKNRSFHSSAADHQRAVRVRISIGGPDTLRLEPPDRVTTEPSSPVAFRTRPSRPASRNRRSQRGQSGRISRRHEPSTAWAVSAHFPPWMAIRGQKAQRSRCSTYPRHARPPMGWLTPYPERSRYRARRATTKGRK